MSPPQATTDSDLSFIIIIIVINNNNNSINSHQQHVVVARSSCVRIHLPRSFPGCCRSSALSPFLNPDSDCLQAPNVQAQVPSFSASARGEELDSKHNGNLGTSFCSLSSRARPGAPSPAAADRADAAACARCVGPVSVVPGVSGQAHPVDLYACSPAVCATRPPVDDVRVVFALDVVVDRLVVGRVVPAVAWGGDYGSPEKLGRAGSGGD